MNLKETSNRLPAGRYLWRCTICRKVFAWDENSWQYGNMAESEVWAVVCSDLCQKQYIPIRPKNVFLSPEYITTETGSRRLP